jgi:hypothetical protein
MTETQADQMIVLLQQVADLCHVAAFAASFGCGLLMFLLMLWGKREWRLW